MVYLQGAARAEGPAGACIELAVDGQIRLVLSNDILTEVIDVLTRPEARARFPVLTEDYVADYLDRVRAAAEVFEGVPSVFVFERDPKDEKYLNLAVAADVQFLVSRDRDLLDLMGPGRQPGSAFRDVYANLTILDPVAFLQTIRQKQAGDSPDRRPE